MKKALPFLLLLFLLFRGSAQDISKDNRLVLLGEATIDVPANLIQIAVSLSAKDSASTDAAYEKYKAIEQKLIAVFMSCNISEKSIKYQLPSFRKGYEGGHPEPKYAFYCEQLIRFSTDSISLSTKLQELLVKNGFTDFQCQFALSDVKKYQKQMLEKAVTVAQEKAETIASASGRKVKRIVKVMDTDESDPRFSNYSRFKYGNNDLALRLDDRSLSNIRQTVTVTATLKVVFELK